MLLGCLFSVQTCLYATELPEKEKRTIAIPTTKEEGSTSVSLPMLVLPKDKNLFGADLTKVQLPQDLSYANLTNANLSGHLFHHTNFNGAALKNVILTNTTCDYRQCFQNNVRINKLIGGKWYLSYLPKDLESIAKVYPLLSQNDHKSTLLQDR